MIGPRAAALTVAALLLAGCASPEGGSLLGAPSAPAPTRPLAERVAAAELYGPSRGPVRIGEWADLPAPPAPVPAVVYVPGCSTPLAASDHVPFLQSQGVAVAVPSLGGTRCAQPEAAFTPMYAEVTEIATRLRAIPWIDGNRIFLMGHAVGADVATTYPTAGTFKGVIGMAAACPWGLNDDIPTLTFRALDDPVLANRGTRCREFESPNSLHLEFAGSDHVIRLQPSAAASDGRALVRRAIIAFVGAGAGTPTIADADAQDLQQLGTTADAGSPPTGPVAGPAEDTVVPAPDVAVAPAAPAPATDAPTTPAGDLLFIPDLRVQVPDL